jgi:hypothetical protein
MNLFLLSGFYSLGSPFSACPFFFCCLLLDRTQRGVSAGVTSIARLLRMDAPAGVVIGRTYRPRKSLGEVAFHWQVRSAAEHRMPQRRSLSGLRSVSRAMPARGQARRNEHAEFAFRQRRSATSAEWQGTRGDCGPGDSAWQVEVERRLTRSGQVRVRVPIYQGALAP